MDMGVCIQGGEVFHTDNYIPEPLLVQMPQLDKS